MMPATKFYIDSADALPEIFIKVAEAKRLLETSDMRVNEISQAVGYENEKHFMKIFKATLGVSPTEYRKSIQLKGE